MTTPRLFRDLPQVPLIEWAAYLFLATLLGLFWIPVALFLGTDQHGSQPMVRFTIVWVFVSCLLYAGLFRFLARRQSGRKPSYGFVLALPFIAATTYGIISCAANPRFAPDPAFSENPLFIYVFAGPCLCLVLTLPAILYQWAIRKLDGWTATWADQASPLSLRFALAGMLTVSLVLVTEARGALERNRQTTLAEVKNNLRIAIPPGAEVIYQAYEPWYETGYALVWVRMPDRSAWPPPIQNPNLTTFDPGDRVTPLPTIPGGEVTERLKIDWTREGQDYSATLFRTPTADYIRYETGVPELSE